MCILTISHLHMRYLSISIAIYISLSIYVSVFPFLSFLPSPLSCHRLEAYTLQVGCVYTVDIRYNRMIHITGEIA